MYKKGQVEDFFADVIPAIVVVVVALIIIAFAGMAHERSVKNSFESDIADMSASDLNTLMRAPADIGALKDNDYDVTMGEAIVLFSEATADRENNRWMWDSGLLRGDAGKIQGCGDELFAFFDAFFSDYNTWNIRWLYKDELVMICYRQAGTSTAYESPETAEFKSKVMLPTSDPSRPVKAEFLGIFEVEA